MIQTGASGGRREALGTAGLVGILVLALGLLAARAGWLETAELAVFDGLARATVDARGGASEPPAVLLLSLGEADFARHGHPIPDAVLADALERLAGAGASAIGVDLYRPPPGETTGPRAAGWAALRETLARHPSIVMAELLPMPGAPALAAPAFVPEEQVGFNDVPVDPGRVVRRGYLYAWEESGRAHVSLALRLAALHLARHARGVEPDPDRAGGIRLGATPLPPLPAGHGAYHGLDAGGYQIALDFRRPLDAFASLSLEALLAEAVAPERIAGRVVLIGTDAPSVQDDFDSPLAAGASVKGHRLHAQLVDQLIRAGLQGDRPLASLPTAAELALVVGFVGAAVAAALLVPASAWIAPILLLGGLLPFGLAAALLVRGVWMPSVLPALAWLGAGGATFGLRVRREARAQRQLVSLFRRFSSAKVADALWRERDRIMEGGRPRPQRVVVTVLMSDLVGYTAAAEKLEPERLLAWIDDYMGAMTRVIEAHGGHVDDYVGDGIKANFGVPIPSEDEAAIAGDARQAVACALEMERILAECNRRWAAAGLPEARQRIGIETGSAVVGAIGSDTRMKYTSLGDTINRAARLESLAEGAAPFAPDRIARILIGEATRRRLADAFVLEDLGLQALKGRSQPVQVHRVLGAVDPGRAVRAAGPLGLVLALGIALAPMIGAMTARAEGGDVAEAPRPPAEVRRAGDPAPTPPVTREPEATPRSDVRPIPAPAVPPPASDPQAAATRAAGDGAPAARPPLLYVPPARGRARETAGAGTRSGGSGGGRAEPARATASSDAPPRITLIAPVGHVGLTSAPSPTLHWHLSAPAEAGVELWLIEGDAPLPILKHAWPAPVRAGFHALSLAEAGIELESGTDYRWLVVLVHALAHRDRDVLAEAAIRRVSDEGTMRGAVEAAAHVARRAASKGLWYDAYDALDAAVDQDPTDAALQADRRTLLEQGGLPAGLR